jgi:3-phenylpropionate/trans-cinnamate dioxygenase ferredoxin reductase subunit
MLGRGEAYDRLPYFFSDQYDVGMEYTGYAQGGDRVVFRGDPASREFIAFWMEDGRVTAAMNANIWDVNDAVKRLIRERIRVDEKRLVDPEQPLEEVAAA